MQRFSCVRILCFLCISHDLLILLAISDEAASCNTTMPLMQCKTPPFGFEGLCAVSESFLKSHCSSSDHAYWDAFEDATPHNHLSAPEITGIYHTQPEITGSYTYVNLVWHIDRVDNNSKCPFYANESVNIIPEVINLTTFANGAFQFSPFNLYLLFNCGNHDNSLPTMANVEPNSPICKDFQKQCYGTEIMPCVQLNPIQDLTLHDALETLSCTHFLSLAYNTPSMPPDWSISETFHLPDLSTGVVQLLYGDVACEACLNSRGQCIFTETTHLFEMCSCGEKKVSKTTCQLGCKGLSCLGVKIAIGAAVVTIVFCMMLLFYFYHRKRGYLTKSLLSLSSNRSSSKNSLVTQRAYMLSKKFGPVATREFSFATLSKATKSFAAENMIGDGGFGAVYLGILRDGCKVAIKRLYHDNFRRMDHFYNEIKILSSIDHPNLVKLYGFCCEDSRDLLLVFEYASNGTVFDQLHDDTKPAMPWKTRLNIARETAEALAYLHSSVTPPIYHRDVKTTNILLDDDLGVKLADFGLSRFIPLEASHVSTAPQGTPGYLDPDYHQCYQLTDKSDVYSFGVVLVELVSAKLAVDMSRDRREINLSSLALMKIGCGAWEDLVDPNLGIKENPDVEMMVKRVLEMAFMCLNAEKDNRPTMKSVAESLATLCNEFGCGSGSDNNAFSFRMDMNVLSPVHETSHLIKTKSNSISPDSRGSIPSSNWMSSNASSHENSF
eukprot:c25349_g2_i3 orf=182-2350(-)